MRSGILAGRDLRWLTRTFPVALLVPARIAIVVEVCPLEEGAVLVAWQIATMAHPEILPVVLLSPLHDFEHSRNITLAFRCEFRMEVSSVVPIGDIDSPAPCYRVRINCLCWCDGVFPFFLHLSVHDQERVVRQVDGDLALQVGISPCSLVHVLWNNPPDTELSSNAQGQRTDHSSRTKVSELIAVIANVLLGAVVAVDECRVWLPSVRRLES